MEINFEKYSNQLSQSVITKDIGRVTHVSGSLIKGIIPGTCIGSICTVSSNITRKEYHVEVVGFDDRYVLLMPLEHIEGIGNGSQIVLKRIKAYISCGDGLLGRVIDGMGLPIDGKHDIVSDQKKEVYSGAINPLDREPIKEQLCLGVRSIDGLLSVGKGQRVGILAGSGVGKSVLLGMMAKDSTADVNVIALIGERGREIREFIEEILGEEGLKKSVIVVATSDQSPLQRVRSAFTAMAIAEYFSSKNKDVLFLMDSVTRMAMAQREIGLNVGEPPTTKGYTPSVFSLLPKLLEKAGNFKNKGSITGLFTTLIEGDEIDDPIGDAVRSIVDGHIILDRGLAQRGHFPAIDVLKSNSRVMRSVVDKEHLANSIKIKEMMANYNEVRDLISIGAYKEGNDAKVDQAVRSIDQINDFLTQEIEDQIDLAQTKDGMMQLNY